MTQDSNTTRVENLKKINEKCLKCSHISLKSNSTKIHIPECYVTYRCRKKRNYYKYHEEKKRKQREYHRYIRYAETKCIICGFTSNLEVHHIIPQSKGGLDTKENTVTLCMRCHKIITSYISVIEHKVTMSTI